VEVTPKSMRIRKIILDHLERKRANREDWFCKVER
jgi:GTP-binding protein